MSILLLLVSRKKESDRDRGVGVQDSAQRNDRQVTIADREGNSLLNDLKKKNGRNQAQLESRTACLVANFVIESVTQCAGHEQRELVVQYERHVEAGNNVEQLYGDLPAAGDVETEKTAGMHQQNGIRENKPQRPHDSGPHSHKKWSLNGVITLARLSRLAADMQARNTGETVR